MAEIGMYTDMRLRGEQQMLLQPRMLQSILVLQLPSQELEGYLLEEAEGNEALTLLDTPPPRERERRGSRGDTESHDEMLRNQPDRRRSVASVVEEQLVTCDLDARSADWVRLLVGCLDERGYLSIGDERLLELAAEQGLAGGEEELARAIATLQRLEPRGIGARDAIEALLLQLDPEDEDYALLCRLLEDFLEELAKNKLPAVARAMGLELDHLLRLIEVLKEYDARPAANLVDEAAPVIEPDVLVEWTGEGHEVQVARSALPEVAVDEEVVSLARDRALDRAARAYLRRKIDDARWIAEAVRQRGRTLLRVSQAVFAHQRGFLEAGPGHLAPLRMSDVAQRLDLHVSTVSRAVAGKYAQTPWGIFPLRSFFQAPAGGEEGPARDNVRDLVRDIVAAEDKHQPLADDDIVAELASRGLKVARRTVAKYRKELGLPSSYRRRRYD